MPGISAAWLILGFALTATAAPPAQPDQSADRFQTVTLTGTAIRLTEALKPLDLKVDAEPIARQIVLKGADGTITPLLSDEASRALFEDDRLQGRRTKIQGRLYPGLPYVQVMSFQVEDEGRLRTPEYYCEICTISVRFPQSCPCCQGPIELRMKPE